MISSYYELVIHDLDGITVYVWAEKCTHNAPMSYIPEVYMVIPSSAEYLVLV